MSPQHSHRVQKFCFAPSRRRTTHWSTKQFLSLLIYSPSRSFFGSLINKPPSGSPGILSWLIVFLARHISTASFCLQSSPCFSSSTDLNNRCNPAGNLPSAPRSRSELPSRFDQSVLFC